MGRESVRRIVLTGPECTGKSTLAVQLAEFLRIPVLTESARAYAEEVKRDLTVDDVVPIARRHMAAEDAVLATHPAALVLDTDLISTVVYGRHYYQFRSDEIEEGARARLADLYLLCTPDLPWTPDGVRDSPDNREEMFEAFRHTLDAFEARVDVISGRGEDRVRLMQRRVAESGVVA